MTKSSFPSDSIVFKDISTGHNSTGNGGDGYNYGNITNNPSIDFQPYNKAGDADVHVKTGDYVDQKAYWNAGGANADAEWFAKAHGGNAQSNGDQSNWSGHDKSYVSTDTAAYQTNFLAADQHQQVAAGIGGNGGSHNWVETGDVSPKIDYANLENVLNDSEHFHVNDFVHV